MRELSDLGSSSSGPQESGEGVEVTPELKEVCEAYNSYQAQTIPKHLMDAQERLWEAVKAFAKSKGWESWTVDLLDEQESRSCKCNQCGDVRTKKGRRPGLYINDKSLRQIVEEAGSCAES